MNKDKLQTILDDHKQWVGDKSKGRKADLRGADLCWANLLGADLRGADLHGANLHGAELRGADLCWANLLGADLRGADLHGTDLRGANLFGADLCWANLRGADLHGTDLRGTNLLGANLLGADLRGVDLLDMAIKQLQSLIIVPETGQFSGWKKGKDLNGVNHLILLTIPADAKRISALSSRKCRASKVIVARIEDMEGNEIKDATLYSPTHDDKISYKLGETIECNDFGEDVTKECAPGIHFFLRKQEAVDWQL